MTDTPDRAPNRIDADLNVICSCCDHWPVDGTNPRQIDQQLVCETCFREFSETPDGIRYHQVDEARQSLDRDPDDYLEWPFPEMQRIAGTMAPGQPYFFAAFSGNGKTTFSWSVVDKWTSHGVRGYVLPLETRDYEWRTGLACVRVGVPPGLALSGHLRKLEATGDEGARMARESIRDELSRQDREWGDLLHVSPLSGVTLSKLTAEVTKAAELGCRYVLVDHIDHITPDDYKSQVAESQRVNRALVALAGDHDMILLSASQLNMNIVKAHSLSKYAPPQVDHLMFPAVKVQVAAGIYGLYRPVDPNADPEIMAAAKRGEVEPREVLKPNTMGVVVMKARHQHGDIHEGARCELAVHSGRVMSQSEWERIRIIPPGAPQIHSQHPAGYADRRSAA